MNTTTRSSLIALSRDTGRLRGYLGDFYGESLAELNERLRAAGGPEPVDEICADLFSAGGKRLRALASLVVSRALEVDYAVSVKLAETVELTHGATLLHDDVIDEADTRRGRVAARRRWDNTLSVLGGDFLLLRSLELVAGTGASGLIEAHRRTLCDLLESEVAQHLSRRQGDLSLDGYISIAEGKTGSLFAFACAAPAYLCQDERSSAALDVYGRAFGVAFQIADDVRDVTTGDPDKPGRLDLAGGVFSLPLRLAARDDGELARALLACVDRQPELSELQRLAARIRKTGAVMEAIEMGRAHLAASRVALDRLQAPLDLDLLHALCVWLGCEFDRLEG